MWERVLLPQWISISTSLSIWNLWKHIRTGWGMAVFTVRSWDVLQRNRYISLATFVPCFVQQIFLADNCCLNLLMYCWKKICSSTLLIVLAWREDYPHWAMCCRVCLCRGSQWTFTVRQCDRIPLPAWVLLPCRDICTTTMPKRNIQVDIFQYLH